ncbi:MAG: polymer-forming cytoskeletal protein [Petrimonas sp.]|nr:polymer-forming cytoskeletal protein [Petrimonas sp.]
MRHKTSVLIVNSRERESKVRQVPTHIIMNWRKYAMLTTSLVAALFLVAGFLIYQNTSRFYREKLERANYIRSRIDGRVEGNISLKQGIILGDKAFVEGNMESDYIILFGHIRGNVKSKEIVLKSTGTVQGDIVTDALEIEMGSRYNGNLKISRIEEVEGGDYEPKPVEIVPLKQYEDE